MDRAGSSASILSRAPSWTVWLGAALIVGAVGVAFATLSVPVVSCTLVTAVVVVAMAVRRDSLLAPTGPLLLFAISSATLPALLGHFRETPLVGIAYADYSRAGVALLVFVLCVLTAYLLLTRSGGRLRPARAPARQELRIPRLWLVWGLFAAAAVMAIAVGVESAGGVHGYLDGLANRRVFFAGRGWILWTLIAPAPASLALVAAAARGPIRERLRPNAALAAAVVVSAGFLFLTGNRMNLIVFAASLAVVFDQQVRRIGTGPLLVGVVVVVVLAQAFLGLVRPPSDSERGLHVPSPASLYAPIDRTGPVGDFGHVASLAMVLSERADLQRQLGRTYLSAATILVPRAIAPWKLPVAGEVVTERLLPRVWAGGTGIQVTAPGESYLNFGWPGIPVVGLLFGVLLAGLRRLRQRGAYAATLLYAIALPRVALLMRGDFGNVIGYLLLELGVLGVALLVARGAPAALWARVDRRLRVT